MTSNLESVGEDVATKPPLPASGNGGIGKDSMMDRESREAAALASLAGGGSSLNSSALQVFCSL